MADAVGKQANVVRVVDTTAVITGQSLSIHKIQTNKTHSQNECRQEMSPGVVIGKAKC